MRSGNLWRLEIRQLLTGRAWLGLVVILSLLVGSTFAKAVGIFTEGSRAALSSPDLAQGMNPFDGILVPTFGSAYLVATLLLPFVSIRQIGADRESGALKLLLGLGCPPIQVLVRKYTVLLTAWAICLLVPLSAALLWSRSGGHLAAAELGGLLFGHLLYGAVVIAVSLLAGCIARSSATASLLVLAATLGSWVIDFEGTASGGWLSQVAALSLTQALRPLERGLLSQGHGLAWVALILMALGYAALWLHPGHSLLSKVLPSISGVVAMVLILLAFPHLPKSWDLTEDRRHSFPIGIEQALVRIPERLDIEVRLSAEDPRWMDLDRSLLRKLQRVVPNMHVLRSGDTGAFGRFNQGGDDRYGEVTYRYQDREDTSRSTSAGEVLPLIWKLTAIHPVVEESDVMYPGYPNTLNVPPGMLWFRLILPLLVAALWLRQHLARPNHT
ncbi:MAG: ABC transporter permease subunit [Acidobacteria bacterium]|nr:ABC transporter permease subunit [Acidobacteriota bacterium]MBI3487169.1 ABC transporter permease subunit [Acidobacteriota bacterium]